MSAPLYVEFYGPRLGGSSGYLHDERMHAVPREGEHVVLPSGEAWEVETVIWGVDVPGRMVIRVLVAEPS